MSSHSFHVRQMSRVELETAIEWANTEGWNPGIHDADCFYAADNHGFFAGLESGRIVGTVSAVKYDDDFGFMGFYLVNPEVRNKGYGLELWNAGLQYLQGRCIGLDSVRPDLVSCKKPEFKSAYVNYRFQWIRDSETRSVAELINLADIPFSELSRYDRKLFGFSRENFLKLWISRPGSIALGITENNLISGYGVIRQCRNGYKIGPLFADSEISAEKIFLGLTYSLGSGIPVFLDVPAHNQRALGLAANYNMKEVFRTTRMYNGPPPDLPLDKWYGVTTFELG